jgi:hypothetical protein
MLKCCYMLVDEVVRQSAGRMLGVDITTAPLECESELFSPPKHTHTHTRFFFFKKQTTMSHLSGTPTVNDNGITSTSTTNNNGIDSIRLAAIEYKPSGRNPTARLQTIFRREGVPWIEPVNQSDKGLLAFVGQQVDVFFGSEEYICDFATGHALVTIGDIMMELSDSEWHKRVQEHYAVRCNAIAFHEDADAKRAAVVREENASMEEFDRKLALEEERQRRAEEDAATMTTMLGEVSLRQANHVEGMLDDIQMEGDVELAEFEAHFAKMDLGE